VATVLVVDDHPANRELVVALLAHSGHMAIEASNGVQALEKLRASRPQLMISDILMPAMDGFQLVRELRADPLVADTKVIFYTAHYHEREARKLATAYGVSDVLVKPADPERILAAIENALGSVHKPPSRGSDGLEREHMRLMADKLSQKVEELTTMNERLAQSELRFRQIAENIREIFFLTNADDTEMLYLSPAFEQVFGRSRDALSALPDGWIDWVHPEDREQIRVHRRDLSRGYEYEYRIIRPDGSMRWVHTRGFPIFDAGGRLQRIAGVAEDVTARRKVEDEVRQLNAGLERRVADRTAALEAVNQELQSFDYSISHDLRAPLAHILGFTAALLEEHGTELLPAPRELLERVAGAAQRMDEMIGDLLALSLSTSRELERQSVDLTELADAILASLRRQAPARDVSIDVERGLVANADPGLLRTVLENLLGNAWKFTSHLPHARIEMASVVGAPSPTFFVRDNGAGFDPRHADKLFAPFQRLHSRAEFEGTGVGLATVQRVIHRHGGRIRAESAPGEGACFFFSLPD
jgi:PAS domain S-box-containing protein